MIRYEFMNDLTEFSDFCTNKVKYKLMKHLLSPLN